MKATILRAVVLSILLIVFVFYSWASSEAARASPEAKLWINAE